MTQVILQMQLWNCLISLFYKLIFESMPIENIFFEIVPTFCVETKFIYKKEERKIEFYYG